MIASAIFLSPLGRIQILGTPQTILSVQFVLSENKAEAPTSPLLREAIHQLDRYFKGDLKKFDLPLNSEGTVFQQKVWKTLQSIPYGETRSYGEIAQTIESPKASRAVGGACNQNPWMILVPCHRVLGQKGELVGYAGGLKIKKALLRLEESRF